MPRKSEVFPKPHLRTVDMKKGTSYNLTIKACRQVSVFDFKSKRKVDKWALFFTTTPKYLILNETRWDQLTEIFGSDLSDDWVGHKVVVFAEEIIVAGKPTMTISITDSPDKNTVDQTPDASPGGPYEDDFKPAPQETEEELRERLKLEAAEKKEADKVAREKQNSW